MSKVVLSTKLIIGEGIFKAEEITQEQAQEWVNKTKDLVNYSGHETVKLLGLEPQKERLNCEGYTQALAITAKDRLEFGREYSLKELQSTGVVYTLITFYSDIAEYQKEEAGKLLGVLFSEREKKYSIETEQRAARREQYNQAVSRLVKATEVFTKGMRNE